MFAQLEKSEANFSLPHHEIADSEEFHTLLRTKKRFIVSISIFFFLFFFSLPILTAFTEVLNRPAIGPITWTWIFGLAQFVMTWSLCALYAHKAKRFDAMSKEILTKYQGGAEV